MGDLLHDWIGAMRRGDHERAWAVSERVAEEAPPRRYDDPALPYHRRAVWNGQPLDGRDVVVRCYHGLGDTIQFLRFLPALRRRAASVTLEIQPRLIPLLGDEPPADEVVPFDETRPIPSRGADVEIMELSYALRMPPVAALPPYIPLPPVEPIPGAVGLCLKAGGWDAARSLPPELLAPLCEGRECWALDIGASALPVRNPEGCPPDMAETAALVARMELVITVDTMIAHLAGAMGKPAWLLLKHDPDWRWSLRSDRSEWYPSLRLYPQPAPGDWAGAIAAVQRDLDAAIPVRAPECPQVPVSWGELIDKITILELKRDRIAEPAARRNVARELALLGEIARPVLPRVASLTADLRAVNDALWVIEDAIRGCEAAGDFGPRFVGLARSVYMRNDRRAALKREINAALGSLLVEEKSYAETGAR